MSSLRDSVFGCLAASQIGSAMGAAVEGWDWRRIESEYGVLDEFQSYEHYHNGWRRQPGTTEDGIERQRVFLRAIRRAGGRIAAQDVADVWAQEVDPEQANWCMEPFDRYLIRLARAAVPATRVGQFSPYTNLISLARSCHPVGLVNALRPEQARRDVQQVGLVLQGPAGSGLDWAAVVAGSIAEACRPGADLDDVIAAGLAGTSEGIAAEVHRALDIAHDAESPLAMRQTFEKHYCGHGVPYAFSYANEIVAKAFAIVKATDANPGQAITTAVNFGRDTDCLAAVSGGIAGALSGRAGLRDRWVEQLDAATQANPHTCLQASLDEMTDIVMDGLRAERNAMHGYVAELDAAMQ